MTERLHKKRPRRGLRGKEKRAGSFGSSALILALSGLLVKVIGMVYKIPLTNLLGDSGMGYFNAAYTVYGLFFVLATSGLPVALSLLVAEAIAKGDEAEAEALYRSTAGLFLFVGTLAFLLMALPSKGFAYLLGNEGAAAGILAVSPTLAFMTYAGALRGFFQGRQRMAPIALSQVVEAVGKCLFGMLLATFAVTRYPLSSAAAYAIFGLTLASFLATLSLFIAKKRFDRREGLLTAVPLPRSKRRAIRQKVLTMALPVTVSAFAATLASSLDLFTVMHALRAIGCSTEDANAVWGNYSALAIPLFNMPTVLILPIAYTSLPLVRSALAKNQGLVAKKASLRALMLATALSLPASLGMSLLAKPILSLLYTDIESVASAAPLLSLLSPAIFPLALVSVASSLLQAYGKLWYPVCSVGIGVLVKLFVTYFGIRFYGMAMAPIGTFCCYTVIAALDLAYLAKVSGGFSLASILYKPFLAAVPTAFAACGVYLWAVRALTNEKQAIFLAIAAAVLLFVLLICLLRPFSEEDLQALGLPEGTIDLMKKWRMLS